MNTKMLVLDIDGTLTNSKKEITPETLKVITEIQEMGHIVVLASGRPAPGMRRYETELSLQKYDSYLLSYNGAKIISCKTGDIVYQRTLPPFVIPSLYRFAKTQGCGLVTYCGDDVICGTAIDEYIELEARINKMAIKQVSKFTEFVDFEVNKCLMTSPLDQAENNLKLLQEKYADTLSIYRSEPFFLEIMPKNVDKATSLEHMIESLHIKKDDVICCGDGYNDITMIKFAGVGVAMGNARDEVKEVADYITGTNNEDGLVEVIKKFIF